MCHNNLSMRIQPEAYAASSSNSEEASSGWLASSTSSTCDTSCVTVATLAVLSLTTLLSVLVLGSAVRANDLPAAASASAVVLVIATLRGAGSDWVGLAGVLPRRGLAVRGGLWLRERGIAAIGVPMRGDQAGSGLPVRRVGVGRRSGTRGVRSTTCRALRWCCRKPLNRLRMPCAPWDRSAQRQQPGCEPVWAVVTEQYRCRHPRRRSTQLCLGLTRQQLTRRRTTAHLETA
jgi:hypothetical protein